jgi:hypothetical protein
MYTGFPVPGGAGAGHSRCGGRSSLIPAGVAPMTPVLCHWLTPAVLFMVLIGGPARADYQPLPLTELFATSDLVALGNIAAVDETTFVVEDYQVLAGAPPEAPLVVKRFRDWSGNARWSPYRAGQRVLLFLTAAESTPSGKPIWKIRGLGDEGEMPVEDGYVYPQGIYLDGFVQQQYEVQHGRLQGYRFVLEDFLSALHGYNRCYRADVQEGKRRQVTIHQICDAQALQRYRDASPLNRYLVRLSE